jgi:hypothetical protein
MGMIIRFTFVEGNMLKRIIINPKMEILKFPYLNLNTYKEIQIFWEVVLLNRVL